MTSPLRVSVSVAIAAVLMLSSCTAAADQTPNSAPATIEVVEPAPTPTPAPTPEVVATPDGVADLAVGAPVDSAFARFDPEYCRIVYPELQWDDAGAAEWDVELPPEYSGTEGRDPVEIFVGADGRLGVVLIHSEQILSSRGVGLGDDLIALTAAHPEAELTVEGGVSDVWTVTTDAGTLVFEVPTDERMDDYWPTDQLDRIAYLRVLAPDVEVTPIAATGGYPRCAL